MENHSDPITAAVFDNPNKKRWAYRQRVTKAQDLVRKEFRAQFAKLLQAPKAEKLLLSAELVADYSGADLQVLEHFLAPHTEHLRVIIFVRSPESSVHSIVQQQAYGGRKRNQIRAAVYSVRKRFETLHDYFGDRLEVFNFHDSVIEPDGLPGTFFRAIPIAEQVISTLDFVTDNQSISLEAYTLMEGINKRLPVNVENQEESSRTFNDLRALKKLPGLPFQIEGLNESEWHAVLLEESELLKSRYGFSFPPHSAHDNSKRKWQYNTLLALEPLLSRLPDAELREAAASTLEAEASATDENHAAVILKFIAARVRTYSAGSQLHWLDAIGADYFKFSALQLGHNAPELALNLMSLALSLRPNAKFMKEQVEHYKRKLDDT